MYKADLRFRLLPRSNDVLTRSETREIATSVIGRCEVHMKIHENKGEKSSKLVQWSRQSSMPWL